MPASSVTLGLSSCSWKAQAFSTPRCRRTPFCSHYSPRPAARYARLALFLSQKTMVKTLHYANQSWRELETSASELRIQSEVRQGEVCPLSPPATRNLEPTAFAPWRYLFAVSYSVGTWKAPHLLWKFCTSVKGKVRPQSGTWWRLASHMHYSIPSSQLQPAPRCDLTSLNLIGSTLPSLILPHLYASPCAPPNDCVPLPTLYGRAPTLPRSSFPGLGTTGIEASTQEPPLVARLAHPGK